MKKYIINLLIFTLPLIVVFACLEYSIRSYKTVMKQKQIFLSEKSDAIEVLILGNSHAADGINPASFTLNTFNAAHGSQSLYFDIEITKKYLSRMKHLKYVLISIDYHSLYFTHAKQRDFMYANYFDINYNKTNFRKSDFSLLLFGYGFKNGLTMLSENPTKTENGWAGFKTTNFETLTDLSGKERVEGFNKDIKENYSNKIKIITKLNRFLKLLKENDITPVVVTLPCHHFYTSHLDDKIVEENYKDIKSICSQNKIEHLDYLFEKFEDSSFHNVDHLNAKGAKIISDKINKEIMIMEKNKI